MAGAFSLPPDYWTTTQIAPTDLEYLHTYLFEREVPLTVQELTTALVDHRLRLEKIKAEKKQNNSGRTYLPKETYKEGDELIFPVLDWKLGKVNAVRAGVNPAIGAFDVISVKFDDGSERYFAANLTSHQLNQALTPKLDNGEFDATRILNSHGQHLESILEIAFQKEKSLVRIAGRWFPRSLLIAVNVGHLNLAEAVLDMAAGEPQPTAKLLRDVALPEGADPKLAEFSLNLALQEDNRFDEVGPAGEVLWCLRRLEPDFVREVPMWLQYSPPNQPQIQLSKQMKALEAQLDDELTPSDVESSDGELTSITISIIYPHLRAGTLPISARGRMLFPTAYESPRVRFTLVDGKSKQRMAGWVVREHGYIYGLREWFKSHQLMPGSLVQIRQGGQAGEVIVDARSQRSAKDWIRTLIVGADGGMVFAMLKQPITAEFNDRMAIYVPDFNALDPLWEKRQSFQELVVSVMREMTKLNPQGHVHAQELYAAVNLVRRIPPAPLFELLESNSIFIHVGDLHFRLDEGG